MNSIAEKELHEQLIAELKTARERLREFEKQCYVLRWVVDNRSFEVSQMEIPIYDLNKWASAYNNLLNHYLLADSERDAFEKARKLFEAWASETIEMIKQRRAEFKRIEQLFSEEGDDDVRS